MYKYRKDVIFKFCKICNLTCIFRGNHCCKCIAESEKFLLKYVDKNNNVKKNNNNDNNNDNNDDANKNNNDKNNDEIRETSIIDKILIWYPDVTDTIQQKYTDDMIVQTNKMSTLQDECSIQNTDIPHPKRIKRQMSKNGSMTNIHTYFTNNQAHLLAPYNDLS